MNHDTQEIGVLVVGPAGDQSVVEEFQRLEVDAERTVRRELEGRGCTVRFVDTTRPPFPSPSDALCDITGLVLLGGGDMDPTMYGLPPEQPNLGGVNRDVDEYVVDTVRIARGAALPTLGICRGAQVLNVAFGGTLIPDITEWAIHHGPTPATIFVDEHIALAPSSRLAAIYGTTELAVRNGHHQAVDRVAEGFVVAAVAADGIVEAIESADSLEWIVGVQWHPEQADAEPQALGQLFDAYVTRLLHDAAGR